MPTSPNVLTIAIDAMGGDNAPHAIVAGLTLAHKKHPNWRFALFGDEAQLKPLITNALIDCVDIHHADSVIADDEKPSQAIRKGRNSSMGLAIKAVKEGRADACISCGNTGALMALSKIGLRTLTGIDRPAICTMMPTTQADGTPNGAVTMLDLGANLHSDANNLFEFAVMGDAFARVMLEKTAPKVALLNIGSEDSKGHEEIKAAAEMLEDAECPIDYIGYIEGDAILRNCPADVIVTDGFTGNIALKTIEGTAKMCMSSFKKALNTSVFAKLGGLLAKRSLGKLAKQIDPRRYNGAMFVGLNGVVVKSHGGSDAVSFASAIDVATTLVEKDINTLILQEMVDSGHIPPES